MQALVVNSWLCDASRESGRRSAIFVVWLGEKVGVRLLILTLPHLCLSTFQIGRLESEVSSRRDRLRKIINIKVLTQSEIKRQTRFQEI
jgi:hypothetical protein